MDNVLRSQLVELAYFFCAGLEICIVFDVFRAQRRAIKTSDVITYIEDVLFWMIVGFILMHTIVSYTNGEIRIYMIIGLLLGTAIYVAFISKFVIQLLVKLIDFFRFICSTILLPFKKMQKFIKKTRKTNKIWYNRCVRKKCKWRYTYEEKIEDK